MRTLLMGLMLGATFTFTFTSVSSAGPLDPPAPTGVVFIETLQGSTWIEPGARARTARTLDRVARALQARPPEDPGGRALRELAFEVHVFGATPAVDVLDAFDIGPLAPAAIGPPSHADWLTHLTPAAFRSTAPYRRLRPGTSW